MSARAEPGLEQRIEDLAARILPSAKGRLEPHAALSDLGFDSLACADLAMAVEEEFGVRLADGDVEGIRSLTDVAEVVTVRPGRRSGLSPKIGRSVRAGRTVAGPVLRWWFHMETSGAGHIPTTGPVIIAPNHRSMWDVPMLVVACPRRMVFMAKRELYRNRFLSRLWFELGGFPVRRDVADLRAVDNALEVLHRGLALGIYPEGTRSFTGEMLPFLKGAAWLALQTGAPIVPCGITGTSRRTRGDQPRTTGRRRVRVVFGPRIDVAVEPDPVTRRSKAEAITGRLLEAITALMA